AATLLPLTTTTPLRPARAAAFAALTRVSLVMGDWNGTLRYADSCLSYNDNLMDFNALEVDSPTPIEPFNIEVLLHARARGANMLLPAFARVDSGLYSQYDVHD